MKKNPIRNEADALTGDAAKNKIFRSELILDTDFSAKLAYQPAVARLLDVNGWSSVSALTADFILCEPDGTPKLVMNPQPGDYILIRLPGPVPENWIRIFRFDQTDDATEFSAHPAPHPLSPEKDKTDHFFTRTTVSTFRVERQGHTLTGMQIGTNERINNQQPEAGDRQIINTVIAEAGWLFYQSIQWDTLCDYWIKG